MARPFSPDYDKRKSKILDTAAEIFAEVGYHKASIGEITIACGISKSLIYHYYKSKQDILFQCMEDHVVSLRDESLKCEASDLEPNEKLKTLLRTFMTFYENAGPRHRILVQDLHHLNDDQRAHIVKIEDEIVQSIKRIIAEATNANSGTDDLKSGEKNGTVLSLILLSMINWTYTWYDPKGPISPEDFGDLVGDIFLNGVTEKN
jgi:AcrR family transcriptional regulator